MASAAQVKKIHTLANKLGISEERYRELLNTYGVYTSKALTAKEARSFIGMLESGHFVWRKAKKQTPKDPKIVNIADYRKDI